MPLSRVRAKKLKDVSYGDGKLSTLTGNWLCKKIARSLCKLLLYKK
jgi:hypothetical protein